MAQPASVSRSYVRDIAWAYGWALAFAVGLSLWVLAAAIVRRSSYFAVYGLTAWQIIGLYFAAAAVGGLVLGMLRPHTATREGAVFVGACIGTIAYSAAGIALEGRLSSSSFLVSVIPGIIVGGVLGYRFSAPEKPSSVAEAVHPPSEHGAA
jgi:hypothetical protein